MPKKFLQKYLNGVKDSALLAKQDSTADSTTSALNRNPLRIMRFIQPTTGCQRTGSLSIRHWLLPLLKDTSTINSYLNIPAVRNQFPGQFEIPLGKTGILMTTAKRILTWNCMPSKQFREAIRQNWKVK